MGFASYLEDIIDKAGYDLRARVKTNGEAMPNQKEPRTTLTRWTPPPHNLPEDILQRLHQRFQADRTPAYLLPWLDYGVGRLLQGDDQDAVGAEVTAAILTLTVSHLHEEETTNWCKRFPYGQV